MSKPIKVEAISKTPIHIYRAQSIDAKSPLSLLAGLALACLLLATLSPLVASSLGDNILATIQKGTKDKLKLIKLIPLKGDKNLSLAVIGKDALRFPFIAANNGKVLMGLTPVFFSDNESDMRTIIRVYRDTNAHNDNLKIEPKIKAMFKALPKHAIIKLKAAKRTKDMTYIIADPNCHFCVDEVRHIDERLKDSDVGLVIISIFGKDSLERAAHIYNEMRPKMSNKEKLEVLNKYFSKDTKVKDIDTSYAAKVTDTIKDARLIEGTPFIYETTK